MYRIVLLWAIALCPFTTLFAQPTADQNIIPQFLDSLAMVQCQSADAQDALNGADQTWDFSGLSPDPIEPDYFFKFFDPQNTPHADRYPEAELAAINADSNFIYYRVENDAILLIGAVAEVPNFGTAFSDYEVPETEEVFPVEYLNSWADDFSGTNSAGPISSPFTGNVSGEVDGYGTLILPNGTFNQVLRVKEERSLRIMGAPEMQSTLYRYVSQDYPLWLLSIEIFPTGPPIIFYQKDPLVISSLPVLVPAPQIHFSPNPISTGSQLTITTPESDGTAILRIYNAQGQLLEQQNMVAGNLSLSIPNHWPTGLYQIEWNNGKIQHTETLQITSF